MKLGATHYQLFQLVFFLRISERFGVDFSADFTVPYKTFFVLNTVYGFSNHQQHLLDLKVEPHLTPSPSWISTCLFGAKGELLYTKRRLRFEIKGIR